MVSVLQKFLISISSVIILFCYNVQLLSVSVDPLSKIIITSANATCVRDAQNKDQFVFQYRDNVRVEFADKSTVTADLLDVIFDGNVHRNGKKSKKNSGSSIESFKKITFKKHVCITNAQRKAIANSAEFYLNDQRCVLNGDVRIWQTKKTPRDIPVAIQSQKAELNLKTGEVQLLGTTQKPVSTTIILEGHPALDYKKRSSLQDRK